MNISSIVVQVLPKNYESVKKALKQSGVCEYHFGEQEKGKMIVTIEGEGVEEEIKKLVVIQQPPNVANSNPNNNQTIPYSKRTIEISTKASANL